MYVAVKTVGAEGEGSVITNYCCVVQFSQKFCAVWQNAKNAGISERIAAEAAAAAAAGV